MRLAGQAGITLPDAVARLLARSQGSVLCGVRATASVSASPSAQSLGFAIFAAVTGVTGMPAQRIWAAWAVGAYLAGAVMMALAPPSRRVLVVLVLLALICPLGQLSVQWHGQHEIWVVQHAAERLVAGNPVYQTEPAALSNVDGYFPYLPAMALLGLPAELARCLGVAYPLCDVRWTFVAVYVVVVVLAIRHWREPIAAALWLLVSPIATLPLATGGDDLPVLAMMVLALTCAVRRRPVQAGLAAGLGCAAKLTAWPLAVALGVMILARRGPAAAGRFAGAALAMLTALVLPLAIIEPDAMMIHALAFPAGLTKVGSPANTLTPGRVLAESFAAGRWVALGLLVGAALCFCGWMLARPPTDENAVAWLTAAGLAVAALLLPASRIGYVVYPVVMALFTFHCGDSRRRAPQFGAAVAKSRLRSSGNLGSVRSWRVRHTATADPSGHHVFGTGRHARITDAVGQPDLEPGQTFTQPAGVPPSTLSQQPRQSGSVLRR
jgi:hypothetical protein